MFADRATYLFLPRIATDAAERLGPEYWTNLGWLYENAHEPAFAREYCEKVLDRNPRDAYARSALERMAGDEG